MFPVHLLYLSACFLVGNVFGDAARNSFTLSADLYKNLSVDLPTISDATDARSDAIARSLD